MKRFGTAYGGFYYPENLEPLNSESVIYCNISYLNRVG